MLYARNFPRPVRRFIEFLMLIKAITALSMLVYVHLTLSRTPPTCLQHVKDTWPKDGILRVEIIRNAAQVNHLFFGCLFCLFMAGLVAGL